MSFQVHSLPIFEDNFVYVLVHGKQAIVVDPGEPKALTKFLFENKLQLQTILITHEHDDHIGGLRDLSQDFNPTVYFSESCRLVKGILNDAGLSKERQIQVSVGAKISLFEETVAVLDGRGHTSEQVLYHFEESQALFSGDLIFHMGCGRIFDGTFEQHYDSLQQLLSLPKGTLAYPTHDYSETNVRFAKVNNFTTQDYPLLHVFPIPLDIEAKWNPFLLAKTLEEFISIRLLRNRF